MKKVSRFAAFSARNRDRIARSFSVFLIGIIVACGIEVAVDWHSTLTEIRVLHERVRERGRNYVAVLVRPLAPVTASRDLVGIERLVGGVFDDQDVVFVRVLAPDASIVYERLEPAYASAFEKERHVAFVPHYAHQLERDTKGVLNEPEILRARMEASRHRDFAQAYQDLLVKLHVAKPEKPRARRNEIILFQDRLYTMNKKEHDAGVTYAIGRIEDESGKVAGVVIVAFDMRPTNAAISSKYLKGAGLVAFFVLLILVQNVTGRREKLRLLDLEAKYGSAKEAIRNALPRPIVHGSLRATGAIAQSSSIVDGILWDAEPVDSALELVVIDPEGDGIEAAAVALHLRATYRSRREQKIVVSLREEIGALGHAALLIPGERAVGVMLLRIDSKGRVEGLSCGMGVPMLIEGSTIGPIDTTPAEGDAMAGVVGSMTSISGEIPGGAVLLVVTNGLGGRTFDTTGVAAFLGRARGKSAELATLVDDAATWARGNSAQIAVDDILVVAVERT